MLFRHIERCTRGLRAAFAAIRGRNMERPNRPDEGKGAGVHIRSKRRGNLLIPERSGHVTEALQSAGRQ